MPPTFTHKKMMAVLLSCTNIICRVRIQTSCDLEHPNFFHFSISMASLSLRGHRINIWSVSFSYQSWNEEVVRNGKGEVLHLIYIYKYI
jgi:hypothetical protein